MIDKHSINLNSLGGMKVLIDAGTSLLAGSFILLRIAAFFENINFDKTVLSVTAVVALIYLIMQAYFLYLKTKKFKRDNHFNHII